MKRRTFLQNSGLAVGGLSLMGATSITSCDFEQKKKLGVCLVGLGSYSSTQLAPALQMTKHCYLAGLVTGSPEKIPVWQEKYNVPDKNIYDYTNFHQIANNDDIDVVYIVLPTGLHSLYTRMAAKAGKHIWCEKPMAMSVAECETMMESCRKNKVKLTIGYRMQHEPNTQQLIEWSKTKKYGEIKNIKAAIGYNMVPDPTTWRMSSVLGGGFLYDLGIYSINAIRYAAQEEPINVFAEHQTIRKELFTEVSEATKFTFEFASGLKAQGLSSAMQDIHKLEVQGREGWMKIDPFSKYDGISGSTSDGYIFSDRIPNQQVSQMDNDALAILNDQEVLVSGIEGMRDVHILEAINQSAETGKKIKL